MKDRSNFYKLPESEQKRLQEDSEVYIDNNGDIITSSDGERLKKYMEDLSSCAYGYLKNIEKDIREKELPYVMSIEAGFGSGKTHFVTRLCQYLRDNKITAVYLDAFEYDNIDPKLAILDAISKNCKKNNLLNELWKKITDLTDVNITKVDINLGIGCSIDLAKLRLKDEMQKIKEALQEDIKENGRMVLIIDELDRCDPRFCVNLLETIKHFFDLDGLFTILSFSDEALLAALSNTYGSDFIRNNSENYLTKFIDHRTKIYGTDNISYSMVVSKFFKDNDREVSKKDLQKISDIFRRMKLSVREVKRCVERIISLMKSPSGKDNLELCANVACRYDENFDKIKDMKYINDYDNEGNQAFSERSKQFENLLGNCMYSPRNNNIRNVCVEICREFGITKCIETGVGMFYSALQNDIRTYYQIICKDSGNAKKLSEIFLSDLFEKINSVLKNAEE